LTSSGTKTQLLLPGNAFVPNHLNSGSSYCLYTPHGWYHYNLITHYNWKLCSAYPYPYLSQRAQNQTARWRFLVWVLNTTPTNLGYKCEVTYTDHRPSVSFGDGCNHLVLIVLVDEFGEDACSLVIVSGSTKGDICGNVSFPARQHIQCEQKKSPW